MNATSGVACTMTVTHRRFHGPRNLRVVLESPTSNWEAIHWPTSGEQTNQIRGKKDQHWLGAIRLIIIWTLLVIWRPLDEFYGFGFVVTHWMELQQLTTKSPLVAGQGRRILCVMFRNVVYAFGSVGYEVVPQRADNFSCCEVIDVRGHHSTTRSSRVWEKL